MKIVKNNFVILLLTAVLVLNQAVFLFSPMNFVGAQTIETEYPSSLNLSIISPSTSEVSDQVTVSVQTDLVSVVSFNLTGFGHEDLYVGDNQGENIYSFILDTVALENGGYSVWINAEADRGDGLMLYAQDSIDIYVNNGSSSFDDGGSGSSGSNPDSGSGTNDSDTDSSLAVNFVSSTASQISGQQNISAQTNMAVNYVNFILSGFGREDQYSGIGQGDNTYFFDLDTVSLENGEYYVWAKAQASNLDGSTLFNEASLAINVYNEENDFGTDDSNPDTQTEEPILFTILEDMQSSLSGTQDITVVFEGQDVDTVSVCIEGPASGCLQKYDSYSLNYLFKWQTKNFPNGNYDVTINATKGSQSESKVYNYNVQNDTTIIGEDDSLPDGTYSPSGTETNIAITQPQNGATVNNWTTIFANTYGPIRRVEFFRLKDSTLVSLGFGYYNGSNWQFGIDTNRYENNFYNIMARAWDDKENKFESNKISIEIKNDRSSIDYKIEESQLPTIDPTYEDKPYYEDKNYVSDYQKNIEYYSAEIKKDPIFIDQPVVERDKAFFMIPWKCKKQGITNMEECEQYMFKLNLPFKCKDAGAQTMEECDKIMRLAKMSPECRELNIVDPEECEKALRLQRMPEECREAGVDDEYECEKIMFKKHGPQICIDAGIFDEYECEKIMFKESAPDDCKEAGIINPEACEKYMFEKYGGMENIPADKYPQECIKAGATTFDECEKVMNQKYMPRECKNQGIDDDNECEIYLSQKYMPQECREAGVKTREKCDNMMFNKYTPQECKDKGLTDDNECKNFMSELYSSRITCSGASGEKCKEMIRDRHIGSIVAKQTQYKEIKERMTEDIGKTMSIKTLEEKLDISRDMIPIKRQETNIKIVSVQEKLILDESENLIQTSPIALMFDSDQDGISDDIEERLGTDPFNADSDGDGYSDIVEIKNNFNPLGEGKFTEIELAPVEQAILDNKTMGHPKTEGELLEVLQVGGIAGATDEQGVSKEGYNFSGQAEADSVVTLYIYSDMPLVVTTKVDRYGNWQYELSESLIEGEHEVYVAVNDNTGKVVSKSNPLNFFIKEAKAVSVQDFVASAATENLVQSDSESITKYYLIITALVIMVGILLFVIFFIQKRKKGLIL